MIPIKLNDNTESVSVERWITRSAINNQLILSDSPECRKGNRVWYYKEGSDVLALSETGLFGDDILPSVSVHDDKPKHVRITIELID